MDAKVRANELAAQRRKLLVRDCLMPRHVAEAGGLLQCARRL